MSTFQTTIVGSVLEHVLSLCAFDDISSLALVNKRYLHTITGVGMIPASDEEHVVHKSGCGYAWSGLMDRIGYDYGIHTDVNQCSHPNLAFRTAVARSMRDFLSNKSCTTGENTGKLDNLVKRLTGDKVVLPKIPENSDQFVNDKYLNWRRTRALFRMFCCLETRFLPFGFSESFVGYKKQLEFDDSDLMPRFYHGIIPYGRSHALLICIPTFIYIWIMDQLHDAESFSIVNFANTNECRVYARPSYGYNCTMGNYVSLFCTDPNNSEIAFENFFHRTFGFCGSVQLKYTIDCDSGQTKIYEIQHFIADGHEIFTVFARNEKIKIIVSKRAMLNPITYKTVTAIEQLATECQKIVLDNSLFNFGVNYHVVVAENNNPVWLSLTDPTETWHTLFQTPDSLSYTVELWNSNSQERFVTRTRSSDNFWRDAHAPYFSDVEKDGTFVVVYACLYAMNWHSDTSCLVLHFAKFKQSNLIKRLTFTIRPTMEFAKRIARRRHHWLTPKMACSIVYNRGMVGISQLVYPHELSGFAVDTERKCVIDARRKKDYFPASDYIWTVNDYGVVESRD